MARTTATPADPITGVPLDAPARSRKTVRETMAEAPMPKPRAKKSEPDMMNMSAAERKEANTKSAAKAAGREFKPPKNLAQCADMYYQKRDARLALERQAALVQAEENACREFLINNLPKSEASGIAGKLCRVAVENKDTYVVKDWDAVWGFILKNAKKMPGITGLLQRRINTGMAEEMAAGGKPVAGVSVEKIPVLRVNKL